MTGAIAVFVKTPGFSPVKTRLAATRGAAFAEHWHRLAAAAVASVVEEFAQQSGWTAYWAVAESSAEAAAHWRGFPTLAQGDGGLGARMARVHGTLVSRHGRGLLIGADSPHLVSRLLTEAADAVDDDLARMVIGMAADGGFWLVGGNRRLPTPAWEGVGYSAEHTGRDMLRALQTVGNCHAVPGLLDVDCASDLPAVLQELRGLASPTAAQRQLADWLLAALPAEHAA